MKNILIKFLLILVFSNFLILNNTFAQSKADMALKYKEEINQNKINYRDKNNKIAKLDFSKKYIRKGEEVELKITVQNYIGRETVDNFEGFVELAIDKNIDNRYGKYEKVNIEDVTGFNEKINFSKDDKGEKIIKLKFKEAISIKNNYEINAIPSEGRYTTNNASISVLTEDEYPKANNITLSVKGAKDYISFARQETKFSNQVNKEFSLTFKALNEDGTIATNYIGNISYSQQPNSLRPCILKGLNNISIDKKDKGEVTIKIIPENSCEGYFTFTSTDAYNNNVGGDKLDLVIEYSYSKYDKQLTNLYRNLDEKFKDDLKGEIEYLKGIISRISEELNKIKLASWQPNENGNLYVNERKINLIFHILRSMEDKKMTLMEKEDEFDLKDYIY